MKKYLFIVIAVAAFAACNNSSTSSSSADSSSSASTSSDDKSSNPDYQKGLALVASSDCLACHKVDEKLTGPSYRDVANKYASMDTAVTYLAHRIIAGVGSNDKHDWSAETNNAIMTPHPQIAEADAEQMVKYILLLKNK